MQEISITEVCVHRSCGTDKMLCECHNSSGLLTFPAAILSPSLQRKLEQLLLLCKLASREGQIALRPRFGEYTERVQTSPQDKYWGKKGHGVNSPIKPASKTLRKNLVLRSPGNEVAASVTSIFYLQLPTFCFFFFFWHYAHHVWKLSNIWYGIVNFGCRYAFVQQ